MSCCRYAKNAPNYAKNDPKICTGHFFAVPLHRICKDPAIQRSFRTINLTS